MTRDFVQFRLFWATKSSKITHFLGDFVLKSSYIQLLEYIALFLQYGMTRDFVQFRLFWATKSSKITHFLGDFVLKSSYIQLLEYIALFLQYGISIGANQQRTFSIFEGFWETLSDYETPNQCQIMKHPTTTGIHKEVNQIVPNLCFWGNFVRL